MNCPQCHVKLNSAAEKFLHEKVHGEPFTVRPALQGLPFVLMPIIAEVMQDYADKQTADLLEEIRYREDKDSIGPVL